MSPRASSQVITPTVTPTFLKREAQVTTENTALYGTNQTEEIFMFEEDDISIRLQFLQEWEKQKIKDQGVLLPEEKSHTQSSVQNRNPAKMRWDGLE